MPTTRSQDSSLASPWGGASHRREGNSVTKRRTSKRKAPPQHSPAHVTRYKSVPKRQKTSKTSVPSLKIVINRAPVLALWTAVVAQREGYTFDEGLTFGRWVSGTLDQSKGRSLGIYEAHERTEAEKAARRRRDEAAGVKHIDAFGIHIPVIESVADGAMHAASEGKPIEPGSVHSYVERSFGGAENLEAAISVMQDLADSIPSDGIGKVAFKLYERFRPEWKGWGGKGHLDLDEVKSLKKEWRQI